MTVGAYVKDSNATKDYQVDWAKWLVLGDTIATSTFIVPAGITKQSESNTVTTSTVWLSGGTTGTEYLVVARITTAQGRTEDQTLIILVLET